MSDSLSRNVWLPYKAGYLFWSGDQSMKRAIAFCAEKGVDPAHVRVSA